MMFICIKQHLSDIWSSIYEKLSNTEAELKRGYYKTTDPPTGSPPTHWPPAHQQVFNRLTDNRPATPRQVLHRPTNHRHLNHQPTNHRPPTHQFTDPPTTGSPTQLTTNPSTHQTYFNRVSTGPILSLIYFNSSFGLGAIYY